MRHRPDEKPTLAEGGDLERRDVERAGGGGEPLHGIPGTCPAHDGEGARRRQAEGPAPGQLGVGQDGRVALLGGLHHLVAGHARADHHYARPPPPPPAILTARASSTSACSPARKRGASSSWSKSRKPTIDAAEHSVQHGLGAHEEAGSPGRGACGPVTTPTSPGSRPRRAASSSRARMTPGLQDPQARRSRTPGRWPGTRRLALRADELAELALRRADRLHQTGTAAGAALDRPAQAAGQQASPSAAVEHEDDPFPRALGERAPGSW